MEYECDRLNQGIADLNKNLNHSEEKLAEKVSELNAITYIERLYMISKAKLELIV